MNIFFYNSAYDLKFYLNTFLAFFRQLLGFHWLEIFLTSAFEIPYFYKKRKKKQNHIIWFVVFE